MALYRYVKAPPKRPRVLPVKTLVSTTMSLVGLGLILWVVYPIISFEITSKSKYQSVVAPVPETENVFAWSPPASQNQGTKVLSSETSSDQTDVESQNAYDSTEIDFTKASNWFPTKPQSHLNTLGQVYYLSIPKLRIQDAKVKIGGEDLNESLIHYGGTGLPGDYGNAVIFGHSILPQFYDPTNYKAIFSLLPKLERGDEIFLKYDGVTYRYVVYAMEIASPDDISVLEQRYDSAYLSLVTCVPPGTYWKRLHVRARLERL